MQFIKQVFGSRKPQQPVEPIFPGEQFTIYQLDLPGGLSFAAINQAYDHYPNKAIYSWHVLVELEVISKNEQGHPTDAETASLLKLEKTIRAFLGKSQTVHLAGRVNRNGFTDLLFYIDEPKLSQEEVDRFCNEVMQQRAINFSIENDPEWNSVGLIK